MPFQIIAPDEFHRRYFGKSWPTPLAVADLNCAAEETPRFVVVVFFYFRAVNIPVNE